MSKHLIEQKDLPAALRRYSARMDGELRMFSNNNRHVYWSDPMQKYIVVRRKTNGKIELEFTATCPCYKDT